VTDRRQLHWAALAASVTLFSLFIAGCGGSKERRTDLAMVSTRDGDYAIYTMDAGGRGQRRLTRQRGDPSTPQGLFFQMEPSWSPDAKRIAFDSKRSGTFDIYVIRSDGTGTRRLTATHADDTHPTWSADGRQLAFERDDKIYVMRADGTDVRAVSHSLASDSDPAWSPGGKWIAFARQQPDSQAREIWIMRPDGSQSHRVTSLGGASINPAWSPGSSRIVFSSSVGGSHYALYIVMVGNKRVHRLTRRGPDAFEPAWSPDGSEIAFSQDGAIMTVDVKGQTARLTDSKNNDTSPTWNPNPPAKGG
jgi:Tol biopolymer transport system component